MFREIRTSETFYQYEEKNVATLSIKPEVEKSIDELNAEVAMIFTAASKDEV